VAVTLGSSARGVYRHLDSLRTGAA
jgi:hypothetical protein